MTLKLKEPRYKHQKQALALKNLPEDQREKAFADFVVGLVESWDYTGEDGAVLPIIPESFDELLVADIDKLSDAINEAVFPSKVKKTNAAPLPSGSTPSKAEKRVRGKSPNGSTISPLAVGQG